MSFSVKVSYDFERSAKAIVKKHKSFKQDVANLIELLQKNPTSGTPLGDNLYKIRIAITSTSKGKSGGARVITYVKITHETIVLAQVYLKTDYDTVDEKQVLKKLSDEGLI